MGELTMLYISILLALLTVILPLVYLRPAISKMLLSLCDNDSSGAAFWLRATDVLAVSGSIILVLMFGKFEGDALYATRMTILLSLCGVFLSVVFVTANVWRIAVIPAAHKIALERAEAERVLEEIKKENSATTSAPPISAPAMPAPVV